MRSTSNGSSSGIVVREGLVNVLLTAWDCSVCAVVDGWAGWFALRMMWFGSPLDEQP